MKPLTGISSLSSGSSNLFSSAKPSSTETSASLSLGQNSNQNGFKAISSDNSQASKPSNSSYNDNIKALNESVAAWIQKHITLNPYVDLTPIFNDYKEHMKNIDLKFSSSTKETGTSSSASPAVSSTNQPAVASTSLFNAPPQLSVEKEQNRSEINTGKRLYCRFHCLTLWVPRVINIKFIFTLSIHTCNQAKNMVMRMNKMITK